MEHWTSTACTVSLIDVCFFESRKLHFIMSSSSGFVRPLTKVLYNSSFSNRTFAHFQLRFAPGPCCVSFYAPICCSFGPNFDESSKWSPFLTVILRNTQVWKPCLPQENCRELWPTPYTFLTCLIQDLAQRKKGFDRFSLCLRCSKIRWIRCNRVGVNDLSQYIHSIKLGPVLGRLQLMRCPLLLVQFLFDVFATSHLACLPA